MLRGARTQAPDVPAYSFAREIGEEALERIAERALQALRTQQRPPGIDGLLQLHIEGQQLGLSAAGVAGLTVGMKAVDIGEVDSAVISQVLHDTPLTVDYEPTVREFVIRDRTNSRMIVPAKDANGDFVDVYGLVTVIDTRDSDRGRLGTVVFSGITSAGTHGAAEYCASARSLRDLRAIFAGEGIRGFPVAYQVVVKCKFSRMLLVSYEYHSHRILQKE